MPPSSLASYQKQNSICEYPRDLFYLSLIFKKRFPKNHIVPVFFSYKWFVFCKYSNPGPLKQLATCHCSFPGKTTSTSPLSLKNVCTSQESELRNDGIVAARLCINDFFCVNVTKPLDSDTLRKEGFIWSYGLESTATWPHLAERPSGHQCMAKAPL